jgi:transposase-like protein
MSTTEIKNRFPGNIDAILYFERLRWGDKIKCAYCDSDKISKRQVDHRFHCSACHRTFSVTAGTFLHGSKVLLRDWLYAFAVVSNPEVKFTIRQLQRDIRVSYTTAWFMYQDIKKLMPTEEEKRHMQVNLFEFLCLKAITPLIKEAEEVQLSEAV